MKLQAILDVECYKNYFLAMFYFPEMDKYAWTERTESCELNSVLIRNILDNCEVVTFNGNNYDIPVLSEAMRGRSCEEIRQVSDMIIMQDMKPWQIEKCLGKHLSFDHVDLIEVAFGKASLKIYGGRLHCPKLQDLPIEPDTILTREQMTAIRNYCKNDVLTTAALLKELAPQIDLRRAMSRQYGTDLRSKSDAQIAETVIAKEIENIRGCKLGKVRIGSPSFVYEFPSFIQHIPEEVEEALKNPFTVKSNGVTEMPEQLANLVITIGKTSYQMGMGGLHSTEKRCFHKAEDGMILSDWDVTSYYPSIILNCGLYPPQLGPDFLKVYENIVAERVAAKNSGDKVKANALKIVVNGSFGKLGSKYSVLYAPNLMVQVTVTGQLSLLMLIGFLEKGGISVVSANTDGVVCKCHESDEQLMVRIIRLWERLTGFSMERSDYMALYSRDVNNYVALKNSGEVKTKGCFGNASISKNPQNEICNIAAIEYLKNGTSVDKTIRDCKDITKFLSLRTVKGGAEKDGIPIGKAVRWYYAEGAEGYINYRSNGNKVPRSDGAKPLMNLPKDFPDDINYDWYIRESNELLEDLGVSCIS